MVAKDAGVAKFLGLAPLVLPSRAVAKESVALPGEVRVVVALMEANVTATADPKVMMLTANGGAKCDCDEGQDVASPFPI